MNETCIVIRGKKQNDDRFRPATPAPDMHWSYQLLAGCEQHNGEKHTLTYPKGVRINWGNDDDDVISVTVSSELWKNNEACFEHLMRFIKLHELTYEFPNNMQECVNCAGHPSCVSKQHAA